MLLYGSTMPLLYSIAKGRKRCKVVIMVIILQSLHISPYSWFGYSYYRQMWKWTKCFPISTVRGQRIGQVHVSRAVSKLKFELLLAIKFSCFREFWKATKVQLIGQKMNFNFIPTHGLSFLSCNSNEECLLYKKRRNLQYLVVMIRIKHTSFSLNFLSWN